MFIDKLNENLLEDYNESITENGAIGYRTTGKALLDLNFSVASLRSASEKTIADKFALIFLEDKVLAMKWLFFMRDIRGGLGERRTFTVVLKYLATHYPEIINSVVKLIPEYGRWDDLLCLLEVENSIAYTVSKMFIDQLKEDYREMEQVDYREHIIKANISLCAKWAPSPNASSKETRKYSSIILHKITPSVISKKSYIRILVDLRKYLNIVETKMSENQWSEIAYEKVPSKANLLYNDAFLRHDEERRREFLSALSRGETKINAGTLYPHDIVHQYGKYPMELDETLEALWKALPNTVNGNDNTIVVADGSGSMNITLGKTNVTALSVANALAIYFAERSSGEFKNKYITFSSRPQLVDLKDNTTLREKLIIAHHHNEVSNTSIEAVFDLILNTAVKNKMAQEDIPKNILIISDMEFDGAVWTNTGKYDVSNQKLFAVIAEKYNNAGYKIPRVIFWNVNSRTDTIPMRENELGVALVSGFSVNIAKMVMSNQLDPYLCLLETINTERYQPIEDAVRPFC